MVMIPIIKKKVKKIKLIQISSQASISVKMQIKNLNNQKTTQINLTKNFLHTLTLNN